MRKMPKSEMSMGNVRFNLACIAQSNDAQVPVDTDSWLQEITTKQGSLSSTRTVQYMQQTPFWLLVG